MDSIGALFGYLWAFLRAAERTTRQRPSKAGDVLAHLFERAFPPKPPDHIHADKNRKKTGAYGVGIWIGRSVLDDAYRQVYEREDAHSLAANFLNRDKSPVGPLSDFVRTQSFMDVATGERRLATLLRRTDIDFSREHFGVDAEELRYHGVPIIGGGFPRFTLWFGTSPHVWLWQRSNEERAAALALPVRALPELALSWSPLGDWRPPAYAVSQASRDYQHLALLSHAYASGMTLKVKRAGKNHAEYLHGTLGGVSGYGVVAGLQEWKGPPDVEEMTNLLASITASGALRPDILLVCSGLPAHLVASEVHRHQASTQHPLHVFHTSMQDLHAIVRHLPWLWFEATYSGGAVPIFSSRDVDIGAVVRFVCFLDYWGRIAPKTSREILARCWRDVRRAHDFDVLSETLEGEGLLPPKWSSVADLLSPTFIFQAPTLSPASDLIREIEEWVLAHHERLGADWRAAIVQLGRFSERGHAAWDVNQQFSGRALDAYRLAAETDNPDSLADVAFLTLRACEVQSGLVLVENLMRKVPERAEEFRRKVFDISEGSLISGDFQRFADIVAWDELKKTDYIRPFVSQAIGLHHDEQMAEAVVRHLLGLGLMNQILHEIHPEISSRTQQFLHDLVPKLYAGADENVRTALNILTLALESAKDARPSRDERFRS